ncbi:MAG: hypothetical protein GT589_00195 [Peptoclostridium sp.]|uniref:hypothetical protein n=1 Tax=Peptoclostridium sp. TaxID=1904860 RepID=UPI00139CC3B3|nr:hypothetical protein [Peptoclostridium sp.]MZQ74563.1 hypothetical protein [Peptoclostridium sp.]
MRFKWPTANADFFKVIGDNTVSLKNNDNLEEEFYEYGLKFKKSAHVLTEYLLGKTDISKLDIYFFAVAYLYRHSLELVLKAIGFKYIVSLECRKTFLKDTFHNLSEILLYITPSIQELIEKDLEGYKWLKSYFNDINTIDKESDSFRYPFSIHVNKVKDGLKTRKTFSIKPVFDKQTHIDLVAFANKIEVAFDLLEEIYKEKYVESTSYQNYSPFFIDEGGDYYGQSIVGYTYNAERFCQHVKAYTESPQYLYNMMCENTQLKDILFIPMCYLYRNAVELSLKEILFEECSYGLQEVLGHISKKKHKVKGLWNLIKTEIEEHANEPEDDVTLIDVENYITQLNNIDGTSDKFRYPADKHLKLHFIDGKKVDVDNVNDFFEQLLSFLSAVDLMMAEHNEWKAEIEAEYRAEMELI